MKLTEILGRNRAGGIIGAFLAIAGGCVLDYFPFGHGLVNRSYDLLFAPRPNIAADEARLIYMDDESFRAMGQPSNAPWDRSLHAKLIDYLRADHAKAVAFDIVFSDPGANPVTDKKFAESIDKSGKVVLAADVVLSEIGRNVVVGRQIIMPDPMFCGSNTTVGSAELGPDDDLVIRKHLKLTADDQLPGISWATAQLAGAEITKKEKFYERDRWINFYGPPLTLPSVSYYRIFNPQNSVEGLPTGYFSNKVVFVGSAIITKFSADRKDEFSTPYSFWLKENKFMFGVEFQATICLNLLRGDWIYPVPREGWWIFLLGGLLGYGLAQLRPIAAVGVALSASALVAVTSYQLFVHQHIFFSWLIFVVAQVPVALVWSISFNSVQLYVQNRLFQQSLQMYLSPKLVKKFASEKDILKPGAKKQMLTILFSDIASFTSISENMDSDDLAHEMNKYFQSAVSNCIHKTDGTIVKYIGDAIFAFWNAPEGQIDHAMRGCEAALSFRDQEPQYVNGRLLVTRIGLHTGVANVGNFGSTARVDYTAIGENINLAARMEGLNKFLGTDVLITEATHQGIAGRLVTRFLGDFQLKGFEKAVPVYELVAQIDKAEDSAALNAAYTEALNLFKARDFAGAKAAFQTVLEINPKDGPTKFYLKQLEEIPHHTLPANWRGEIEIKEK